uniref:ENTH domain-containing protein n=1 Tax=Opuntia streptacantha TaxID=393608 RepID=A0A7C9CIL3_OPUST
MGILGDIIGKVKDKASIGKAALLSRNQTTAALRLTILRATTHEADLPPSDHHLAAILSAGDGPRASAAVVIDSLMRRLHKTSSSAVALKCLLALHVIVRRGSFILHDQLSIYPSAGGRNYLKLSDFRDNSSPTTWELSTWIRWYAKYLEQILSTSRILGYFLFSTSCTLEREKAKEIIASLLCKDLLREIDGLINVLEEICKSPDCVQLEGNRLLIEVMGLVGEDYFTTIDEIVIRVEEFKERLSCLSFVDSVELVCALKRLEDCKDRLGSLFEVTGSGLVEDLWVLVSEMKEKVGEVKGFKEEKMVLSWGRFESARFGEQVVKPHDSVQFASNRFAFQFAYGELVR